MEISGAVVLFLLWCGATILLGKPLEVFSPWKRLIYFGVMLVLLSPMVRWEAIDRLRRYLWVFTLVILIAVPIVSIFMYAHKCFQAGELLRRFHGMTLGGLGLSHQCGMAAIIFSYLMFRRARVEWVNILYGALTIICIYFVFIGGSRMGGVSLVAGLMVLVYYYRSKRALVSVGVVVMVILSIIAIAPLRDVLLDTYTFKFEGALAHSNIIYTRASLWEARIAEIMQSPVWGVGFSGARELALPFSDYETLFVKGRIEPGSSWLGLTAQLGIVGLALFIWVNVKSTGRMIQSVSDRSDAGQTTKGFETILTGSPLVTALYVVLICQGFTEGYILSAGSFHCFMFWLLLSIAKDRTTHESK